MKSNTTDAGEIFILTPEKIQYISSLLTEAGTAVMKIYESADIRYNTAYKKDNSPVTDADLMSNNIISAGLLDNFPDIPIISEESDLNSYHERKKWEYAWLLDPLDGTKEFINRSDEFSINLALIKNGAPVAGFIYLPVFKILYYAIQGSGAFEVFENQTNSISVNTFSLDQKGLRIVASRSEMDSFTRSYIEILDTPEIINLGSALKFISIAKGDADYYPRMIHIMEWDTAAGQIIIEEAGGTLVQADSGLPLTYNKSTMINPYFIASGKII
jgi:3'(2'), 5'-bisphosphate nucleotidase